jgi:DNA-binding NarL/FixJ family response regulator
MPRPRVLLADDHLVVLEAFRRLLEPRFDVVATVADGQALIKAAEDLKPDLILMDLAMPHLNGLDACERLKPRLPRTRLVLLTMNQDPDTAREAIRRGAAGYVLKTAPSEELFEAIRQVLLGGTYISAAITDEPAGIFAQARAVSPGALSLRQREVLQLLAEGKSMKEAAHLLQITPRTIAFHKYSIMQQLGLKTTAELVQRAVALGLVRPDSGKHLP